MSSTFFQAGYYTCESVVRKFGQLQAANIILNLNLCFLLSQAELQFKNSQIYLQQPVKELSESDLWKQVLA